MAYFHVPVSLGGLLFLGRRSRPCGGVTPQAGHDATYGQIFKDEPPLIMPAPVSTCLTAER